MSRETIITCDRCGKSNDPHRGLSVGWAKIEWEVVQFHPMVGVRPGGQADLCPDCATELGKWLETAP